MDNGVLLAYVLCLASALLCVVYGVLNWNKGAEEPTKEDKNWALEENKYRKKF